MKLKLLLGALVAACSFANAQVIKISQARLLDTPSVVTVRGIVTNGTELGQTIRYFQDTTAGLSAFYTNATFPTFATVKRGDSLEVTGKLKIFNGLLEIDPIQAFTVINSNNPLPAPLEITPAGFVEANESKLVKISGGVFTGQTTTTFAGNRNYNYVVNGTTLQVRVNTGSALIGKLIPTGVTNVTGLLSEFRGTYQLLPRDSADLETQTIAFTTPLAQSNTTTTAFDVTWTTSLTGTTRINYGTTPTLGTTIDSAGTRNNHRVRLSNLQPATIYYVQASSTDNGVTISTPVTAFITASTSTGNIRVLFNHAVDTTVALPGNRVAATTGGRCESEILSRIQNARQSIDVAMYSNGSLAIRDALKAAAARGVRVRYVADRTASHAIFADTASLGFKFVKKPSTDLMHNKFFIIDPQSVDSSWVISGAMNLSTNQIYTDYNDLIMIQDQGLARTYTVEFNEMWGSTTAIPDSVNARFGSQKTDNTPHNVIIGGGKRVESFFSPSDRTSTGIINAINSANNDLQFSLLVFTYFDLGTVVNNARVRGVAMRGLVDKDTVGASSQIAFLQRNGGNVKLFDGGNTIFHYKYAIVDANAPTSDPLVVTGSHNWSNAAETRNDENCLIIHDAAVANLYLQDFEARWKQVGVGTKETAIEGFTAKVYPNPAQDVLNIEMENTVSDKVNVTLYNMLGQPIEAHFLNQTRGNSVHSIDLSYLQTGQYLIVFDVNGQKTYKKVMVSK